MMLDKYANLINCAMADKLATDVFILKDNIGVCINLYKMQLCYKARLGR